MGTRLLSIVYNGYTISEAISWTEALDYDANEYRLSADFLLTAASATALHTAVANAGALNANEGDLTITMDGSNRRVYTSGTHVHNVAGKLSKPGHRLDSETSNVLRFEYRATTATTDDGGRLQSSYTRNVDASGISRVTISGRYSHDGAGGSALSNYDSGIAAWVTTVFGNLGLTEADYDLVEEVKTPLDDEGGLMEFRRVYEEVQSTPNNANIKRFRASIHTVRTTPRGDKAVTPLIRCTAIWSCSVDQAIGDDEDLRDLYTGTIRADLIDRIKAASNGTRVYVISDDFRIDETKSDLQGALTAEIQGSGGALFFFEEFITVSIRENKTRRRRWSGQAHDYTWFSPGPTITGQVLTRYHQVAGAPSDPPMRSKAPFAPQAAAGRWDSDGDTERRGNEIRGDSGLGGDQGLFWEVERTTSWTWVSTRSAEVAPSAAIKGFGGAFTDIIRGG